MQTVAPFASRRRRWHGIAKRPVHRTQKCVRTGVPVWALPTHAPDDTLVHQMSRRGRQLSLRHSLPIICSCVDGPDVCSDAAHNHIRSAPGSQPHSRASTRGRGTSSSSRSYPDPSPLHQPTTAHSSQHPGAPRRSTQHITPGTGGRASRSGEAHGHGARRAEAAARAPRSRSRGPRGPRGRAAAAAEFWGLLFFGRCEGLKG